MSEEQVKNATAVLKEESPGEVIRVFVGIWKAIGELANVSRPHSYADHLDWHEDLDRGCFKKEKDLQQWLDSLIEEWNADTENVPIAECVCVNSHRRWASKHCEILTTNLAGLLQPADKHFPGYHHTDAVCLTCLRAKESYA